VGEGILGEPEYPEIGAGAADRGVDLGPFRRGIPGL
jgi:hypothetical protein